VKASIALARNIEDVFDFLRRPDNLIDKKLTGWISFDADGPVRADSTFNANFKIGPFTGTAKYEVRVYERPYKLGLLVTSSAGRTVQNGWPIKRSNPPAVPPMEDLIELKAAPGDTRLTRTFRVKSRNPIGGILGLPLSPLANWGMRRDLRRLKARIESGLP